MLGKLLRPLSLPQKHRTPLLTADRGVPVVQSTAEPEAGQKRAREDEAANGDHPAKKVDAKE